MFEAYIKAFKNYANFSGRTSRGDYWYFILAHALINGALCVIDGYFLTGGIIWLIYGLAGMIPSVSVLVRRLHDTGRSGWYYWLIATVIGIIPVFIWLVQPGTPGPNQYGPDPNGGCGSIPAHSGSQACVSSVSCIAGSMCGRAYPVGGDEIVFGRDNSAWIRFSDNEPGVSRVHCKLFWSGNGQLMLMDCGSTYGTYVSGIGRLSPHQPVVVQRGTSFYLGSKKVGFRLQ